MLTAGRSLENYFEKLFNSIYQIWTHGYSITQFILLDINAREMNAHMHQNIYITIFTATLVIISPNTGHSPYFHQR